MKSNPKKAIENLKKFDWSRVDAMIDQDIAHQISINSDTAPDVATALKNGVMERPPNRHKTGF